MSSMNRIAYLDGIRAVAIAAVVLDHWGFLWGSPFRGGYIGVDLFFVLSGYIITKLIRRRGARFSYRAFLIARVRRLYPALVGVVLVVAPLSAALTPQTLKSALRAGAFALAQVNTILVPLGTGSNPFGPTWSLSAEWCCYLVLPAVLLTIAKAGRRIGVLVLGLLAVILFAASALWLPGMWLYYGPSARGAELVAGAVVAVLAERPAPWCRPWLSVICGGFGVAFVIVWSILGVDEMSDVYRWIGMPLAVLAGCALIVSGLTDRPAAVTRGLASAPFAGLGRVSYSLYLWHAVPLELNSTWSSRLGLPLYLLVSLAFVAAATALSARYLEGVRPRRPMTIDRRLGRPEAAVRPSV